MIFCALVALRDFTLQLLALSVDNVEIIVSKLAPLADAEGMRLLVSEFRLDYRASASAPKFCRAVVLIKLASSAKHRSNRRSPACDSSNPNSHSFHISERLAAAHRKY
jgi:hypothetical protein